MRTSRCPRCRTALDEGPVLYRCSRCRRAVYAADLEREHTRGRENTRGGDRTARRT